MKMEENDFCIYFFLDNFIEKYILFHFFFM